MTTPLAVDTQLVAEIKSAIRECSDRGLVLASKWYTLGFVLHLPTNIVRRAAELHLSIPANKRKLVNLSSSFIPAFSTSTPARARSPPPSTPFTGGSPGSPQKLTQNPRHSNPARHPDAPLLNDQPPDVRAMESELEAQEEDILVTARACVHAKEFKRAIHVLRDCRSSKAHFLSIYSQFIVTEKQAQRDWHKLDNNRHQPPVPVNNSLSELLDLVYNATDPWLLFLKGLFLARLSRREESIESILRSIAGFPWNWSAWTLLGSCIGDGEELSSLLQLLPLPPTHPLVQMFQTKTLNELHNPSDHELHLCCGIIVNSYSVDFGQAEVQFEKILALDPYRIDDIDVYSNILYVTDSRLKLSRLAHEFLALDKDRPEVCCLVGNHYSLRAEHEKAVKYFRRATQLDRTYLSAWTLMGHEYVEMKNSHAAIEAYRRAVDVNRKDYRAWYGLGQAYELLSMHHYALHYYQHATALRPYDVRLWQAQGMCYEEIGRLREAVECLKHALIPADPHEITINLKLARLHHALEEPAEAVAYHRKVVEVCQADERPIQDYAKSSLEVAEYHMRIPNGDLALARDYLEIVASSNAEDVGRAAELLKTVKATIQAQAMSADNEVQTQKSPS
ncbi:Anaphase-promoting complex subunit 8 [Termitomyces sp. J132]|nr:Anaphase-promoting complex subunit 8 [Termitomyces sp. J132]